VTVSFTAADNPGGSGMSGGLAKTEYSTDAGASWTEGTSVTVNPDPANHSTDGLTLYYRSTDAAGNMEATKSCTVRIDTCGPVTSGAAVSVKKSKKATFWVKVADPLPCSATGATVTITIRNSKGKVVKTLTDFAPQATNVVVPLSWAKCTLAKGTYRYVVNATDEAGNPQASAGGNKLVVT
jgi:hypothetical protein